jgi:hypothetical protein
MPAAAGVSMAYRWFRGLGGRLAASFLAHPPSSASIASTASEQTTHRIGVDFIIVNLL